jgi:hypothetical protein
MADTWIAPFAMNQECFDSYAKETVRISNGTCTLDHSSPEAFALSHQTSNGCCIYTPSEAIALRVLGVTKTGDPIVGFTYRKVDPAHLRPTNGQQLPDATQIRKSRFIGRV